MSVHTRLASWLLAAGCLFAQNPTASLVGEVRDTSGAVIPNALIEVRNLTTNEVRKLASSSTGTFTITGLQPGIYDVEARRDGFRVERRSGLALQIDQSVRLDFELKVGSLQDSVVVRATPPLVNTENAVRGEVIAVQEIAEMPLPGRDYTDLALLIAGVQAAPQGLNSGPLVVAGARPDNTNYTVDGFSIQNPVTGGMQTRPPLDAMQEFKVQLTNYSAEYGRLAGGVLSMALKNGGNQFHGSLFEFFRNEAMDARNFFDQDKSKLRLNQFGGQLDGPVLLPRLYNGRNRTFFVANWEHIQQSNGNARLSRVPTEIERAGDFSATRDANGNQVFLKDPFNSGACTAANRTGCYPNNRIPPSQFNAVSARLLEFYPLPNLPDQLNNIYRNRNSTANSDRILLKLDHRFSPRHNVSYRYMRKNQDTLNPFAASDLGVFGNTQWLPETLNGFTYTWLMTPRLLLDSRVGLVRSIGSADTLSGGRDWNRDLGIPYGPTDPKLLGLPRVTISGLATIGAPPATPQWLQLDHWDIGSTLAWAQSRQTLKVGFETGSMRHQNLYSNNVRGTYNFLGRWTNAPFADSLLGLLNNSSRQVGSFVNDLRTAWHAIFVQDDIKVNSRLTVNLGLRYELLIPPKDAEGRLGNWVPELQKVILADDRAAPDWEQLVAQARLTGYFDLARNYGLPESLVYTNKKNFAPRVGFAWRPFGGARTAVRSGYGFYYGTSQTNPLRTQLGAVFPFANSQNFNRVTSDPAALTFSDPFPERLTQLTGTTSVSGYELRPAPQSVQNWNFTVEHELTPSLAIEVGYAGSKGTHLSRRYDINQAIRTGTASVRPVAAFNSINMWVLSANSSYNAGTLTLRKRFANRSLFRVNYSFGKSIDDASASSGASAGGFAGAQDARNLRLERGRSDWDTRHNLTANFIYELPSPKYAPLRGWQIAGSVLARSGLPFTPRTSNVVAGQSEATRPNRIRNGDLENPTPERWFDLSAFPVVPAGSGLFGNSGRNILDGPGSFTTNLSLSKRFRTAERSYLQLRWEAFNATNHANLGFPNLFVNDVNGGTITSAADGRSMQLALRYVF